VTQSNAEPTVEAYLSFLRDEVERYDRGVHSYLGRLEAMRLSVFALAGLVAPTLITQALYTVVLLIPLLVFALVLNGLHSTGEMAALAAHRDFADGILHETMAELRPSAISARPPPPWATVGGSLRAGSPSAIVVERFYIVGAACLVVGCIAVAWVGLNDRWWLALIDSVLCALLSTLAIRVRRSTRETYERAISLLGARGT
jgi:hypothetical protein